MDRLLLWMKAVPSAMVWAVVPAIDDRRNVYAACVRDMNVDDCERDANVQLVRFKGFRHHVRTKG